MARRKVTKTTKTTRRGRIPNGYCRIDLQMPDTTYERIIQHVASATDMDSINTYIMKCIYDKLPVKYKVDKSFTFPFGKYTDETAESVQQMDPEYISWACRTIQGFELDTDMKPAPVIAATTTFLPVDPYYYTTQISGTEKLDWSRNGKVWARDRFSGRIRFVGRFDASLFYRR